MKALKAFIKRFEGPQRSVKIKIQVNFYFNKTFYNARDGKGYFLSKKQVSISLALFTPCRVLQCTTNQLTGLYMSVTLA